MLHSHDRVHSPWQQNNITRHLPLRCHWRKIPWGQEMVAVLRSLSGDLVTLADRLVLPPVLPLTDPAAVGHIAASPTRTCLPWATHVTGAHIKARWGTLDNLKSGFMSASDETINSQWWRMAKSFWQKSSQRVNRDWGSHKWGTETIYMVGGKRGTGETRGKGKFTQFITARLNNP